MDKMKVAVCQITPVWLNKKLTLEKVAGEIEKAAKAECKLIAFPEALVPGYPFWVERTDGAVFNSDVQKDFYAHYMKEAVHFSSGDMDEVCRLAKTNGISIYLGIIERAADRGNHSLYCIASPDGEWLVEPVLNEEKLIIAEIDHGMIRRERHNFDPSGHYARPDVFTLNVNTERQSVLKLTNH